MGGEVGLLDGAVASAGSWAHGPWRGWSCRRCCCGVRPALAGQATSRASPGPVMVVAVGPLERISSEKCVHWPVRPCSRQALRCGRARRPGSATEDGRYAAARRAPLELVERVLTAAGQALDAMKERASAP